MHEALRRPIRRNPRKPAYREAGRPGLNRTCGLACHFDGEFAPSFGHSGADVGKEATKDTTNVLEADYIPEGMEELQLRLETASAALEGTSQAKDIAELAEDLELARRA